MTKDLSEGVVLDLDMETLEDYSGNGNNGVATGTTLTFDKDNRYNKARSFNGSSDYIHSNSSVITSNEISLSIWFNTSSTKDYQAIFWEQNDNGDTNGIWVRLEPINNRIRAYISDGSNGVDLIDNTNYNDGKWHNIVCSFKSGNSNLYIDSELKDTDTGSYNDVLSNNYYGIGAKQPSTSPTDYFEGKMAKPKVWNRALTAKEVAQDYAEISHNYQGLFDGLVAGYDFKNNAKDFSGNGNDGVVNGATLTKDHLGIVDSAYSFDTTQYIDTNYYLPAGNNNWTVILQHRIPSSGWVSGTHWFMGQYSVPDTNMNIFIGKGSNDYLTTTVRRGSGWTLIETPYLITNDDKTHVYAFSREGINLYIYVDGVLVDTRTDMSSFTTNTVNQPMRLLSGADNSNNIDSVFLIYNKELSSYKIKQITDLLSKGKLYPYPKQVTEGVAE